MGFSGDLVFGRSERPLLEAQAFDGVREKAGHKVDAWWPRPGGWQTLSFGFDVLDDPDAVLAAIVAETGVAACVASVYASDVATVTGLSPEGKRWQACLHLEIAAALWAEEPGGVDDESVWVTTPEYAEAVRRKRAELESDVPASARGALAWAAAAGVGHSTEAAAVERLLRSHQTFVEDHFAELLDTLGFPPAARPDDGD